jgi:hypothetical protein
VTVSGASVIRTALIWVLLVVGLAIAIRRASNARCARTGGGRSA